MTRVPERVGTGRFLASPFEMRALNAAHPSRGPRAADRLGPTERQPAAAADSARLCAHQADEQAATLTGWGWGRSVGVSLGGI